MSDIFSFSSSVVPIPPSYTFGGEKLDFKEIINYLNFLRREKVSNVMTTIGTSQFNLLTSEEIREFNKICDKYSENSILGLPLLSLNKAIEEIKWYNQNFDKTNLIIMYPDRYYEDDLIVEYFHKIADHSAHNIYVHAMWMRNGTGGLYNYTSELVNKIAEHDMIVGMKEEQQTLDLAYKMVSKIKDKEFIVIPAGGSMRRHNALYPHWNVKTFLSGIGNVYPEIEMNYLNTEYQEIRHNIITKLEDPFFDVTMKIGWHLSLRQCLKEKNLCCTYDRQPWPKFKSENATRIRYILNEIQKKLKYGY